ncbi:amidohydrolase [Rothia aerolata]|uniref:Amidohydrolase n=2 Tax=Rothia aerolata TaxID=1812262 RepID=A0A917MTG4_9MICC|nr:amidohydrolase [Rothia aerolata]GGH62650.1 amidohydrolase [Rothia aerolata]
MAHPSLATLLDSKGPVMGPRIQKILPELIDFRREVHQNPELSFVEHQTTQRIYHRLREAGMNPVLLEGTGCYVDLGRGPFAVALRADIDALPILEQTGLPYASQNPGVMHACGHDIHQTVMLGVALALHEIDAEMPLSRTVRIIFQPAEEQLPGGAVQVISQGVLHGIPRAFALHCEPKVEVGKIGTRIGAITSASDTIKIKLRGHGGHTSRPHLTEDLIYAMSQIAINVPAVLSRLVDVRSGILVAWGQIEAGVAPNAIPSEGFMAGTMRCLDADAWYRAGEILDQVIEQVAAPYGVEVEVEHIRGVPPVVNTEDETAMVENAARQELGEDSIVLVEQSMGGEDFAWMLQEVPGTMIRLGTHTPGGPVYDIHQGDYAPDERAIGFGVAVMATAALRAVRWETARLSAEQFRSSSNYG